MKKTLYLKFLLAYIIFGCFGFIVVATFSSSLNLEHLKRESANSLYKEASLISKTYASELYQSRITIESAHTQINALATYLSASIWIVNPSGMVVLNSDEATNVDNPKIIKDFDPAVTSDSFYVVGNFFGEFEHDTLSVFTPISSNYKIKGYVIIHKPMSDISKSADSLLGITYITLVLLIFLSLIILLFFTEMFYIPLKKIIAATEQYASGNYHYELNVESGDEIGYLATTLNYMASEIAQSEDAQKKFVANVSHDFRSPLTSIKGYLEAMLDGTIPPEMHEKYLNIVLNETERLTKLTNSLLTLNNLNTKGMILDRSDFDINQMIKNISCTFEGTLTAKEIMLDLVLTGEKIYVNADMSKIQQVLYNLLDNAIKFSNHNSTITIETREKKNRLFVSVKDNGMGIPKENLKLIFDRFFKSDISRGKDKKGTGLGLSITKEIIHSHGENINVISTEGVGSEFIFSLLISESMDEDDI